jgi:hypothetical protein
MKILDDKYALLKLRKGIDRGPIFHTKKEIIYGLSINNIIKDGKTISFHDVAGKLVYKGSDYIYKKFSIYAFVCLKLLNKIDSKNDTSDWRTYIDYEEGEIIGSGYLDGPEDERKEYIIWLKEKFPEPDQVISEEMAFTEGHRSYIKGVRDDWHNYLTVVSLDGRYTKVTKKNGTIVIYDHSEFRKYVCSEETGYIFVEAPNGEKYEEGAPYFDEIIEEDSKLLPRFLNIIFRIQLKFIHLFKLGYDNSRKFKC